MAELIRFAGEYTENESGENITFADIGCDHGKISIALAKKFPRSTVYATDISSPSLAKAVQSGSHIQNLAFFAGDGFSAVPKKPDVAVIAGMGGEVIGKIIRHEFAQTRLVLQPMKDSDILYEALFELGFCIPKVKIAREDRRFYEIIAALPGKSEKSDFFLPPLNALIIDDNAIGFLKKKQFILSAAARGAENNEPERFTLLKAQIDRIGDVLKNASRG